MRKIIFYFLVVTIVTTGIISGCKKKPSDQVGKVGKANGSKISVCLYCGPPNVQCTADCLFDVCCVCYNPVLNDASCGCYWGVAICKAVSKSSEARTSATVTKTVKLHPGKLQNYFKFLDSLGVNIKQLKDQFNKFDQSKIDITRDLLEITTDESDSFRNSYQQFITSLSQANLSRIKFYIDHH